MKSFRIPSCALLTSMLLSAQLTVPRAGVARYPDGSIHIIHGIPANLIVDSGVLGNADTASFSDAIGLLAGGGLIRLLRADGTILGQFLSDDPQPLLQINAAWLPSKHLLLQWDGTKFVETPIDDSSFAGKVTFLSLPATNVAQFYVTRGDSSVARITVSLPSGVVTSADTQPAAHDWLFIQQGWTLSSDEHGFTAENAQGNMQTIALSKQPLPSGDLILEQMSNHWLHIASRSTRAAWAVYLDQSKLNVSLLPPPAPEAAR